MDLLLTLWLNKVCEAVFAGQQQQEGGRKSPRSPDPKQRKRLRSSGGDGAVPHIEKDLFAGIRDGRCFAALLLHYVPQDCKKEGQYFQCVDQSLLKLEHPVESGHFDLSHSSLLA